MSTRHNTRIINLFAGPGAGKSTTAAGLFYQLKSNSVSCELVTEFCKDLTWEQRHGALACQPYVFGKQLMKLHRLMGQVDYVITDSPLLLGSVYCGAEYPSSFKQAVKDIYLSMPNIHVFLDRVKTYHQAGRNQTEGEAREIDRKIELVLRSLHIDYFVVTADAYAPDNIIKRFNLLGVTRLEPHTSF